MITQYQHNDYVQNQLYMCFISLATFPPVVMIDDVDYFPFGRDATLMCSGAGSPSLSYVWINPKGLVILSSDPELNFTVSQ